MRVFQIKAKSRSPKDKTNNKINISTNNFKKSSNKISQKGRNKNEPKDLEKFLKIKRNKNQIKDKEYLNKISEKEKKKY